MKNRKKSRQVLVEEFLKRAADDEKNAIAILAHRDGTPALVCFLSHQIAEKYLKALLLFYTQDYPKIHDLVILASLLEHRAGSVKMTLKEKLVLLGPYYVGARYPADIPLELFNWQKAKEAFRVAQQVKRFVMRKMRKRR